MLRDYWRKRIVQQILICLFMLICIRGSGKTPPRTPAFQVLVLTERGGIHEGFVVAALDWLKRFSAEQHFAFTVVNDADSLSEAFLSHFQVFLQLNFPPYRWSEQSKAAFIKYMQEGKIGWVGFHHASLLGEFDGYPMWN